MSEQLVLLVDDDEWVRKLVPVLVKDQPLRVHAVSSAIDALKWLGSNKERPAAILADFRMPEVDGLTFVNHLRTKTRFANIPFVVITASDEWSLRVEAAELGCAGYITKPFNQRTFGDSILDIIGQPRELAFPKRHLSVTDRSASSDSVGSRQPVDGSADSSTSSCMLEQLSALSAAVSGKTFPMVAELCRTQHENVEEFKCVAEDALLSGFLQPVNVEEARAQWHEHPKTAVSSRFYFPTRVRLNAILTITLLALSWRAHSLIGHFKSNYGAIEARVTPNSAVHSGGRTVTYLVSAVDYSGIATNDLFSTDRSSTITLDSSPPRPPSLPIVYGVLGLASGSVAIVSDESSGGSRSVRAGDVLGVVSVVSIDNQRVVFEASGKQTSVDVASFSDRLPTTVGTGELQPVKFGSPMSSSPQQDHGSAEKTRITCIPGDSSPIGTVAGRYQKVSVLTSSGAPICAWLPVQ
jgi:CheY-like chemotaxis protein